MGFALFPLLVLLSASPAPTLNVFAAASLKDAFTSISQEFERRHPGTTVALNFAGSQTLAAQILHGAPADVFASAARKNLDDSKPDPSSIRVFATNRLVIVVRTGYSSVKGPKTLSAAGKIVLADVSVPAGRYAEMFLAMGAKRFGDSWKETVVSHVMSRETDVRSVLAKVMLGEADAGIVYLSDSVAAKGRVKVFAIPGDLNVRAEYPIGIMPRSPNGQLAQKFVDSLFTLESQKILTKNGFLTPSARSAKSLSSILTAANGPAVKFAVSKSE